VLQNPENDYLEIIEKRQTKCPLSLKNMCVSDAIRLALCFLLQEGCWLAAGVVGWVAPRAHVHPLHCRSDPVFSACQGLAGVGQGV